MATNKEIIFGFITILSFALGLFFSICPLVAPNVGMTGIWLTFSLFSACLAWPDIVESISFMGNKIKLREISQSIDKVKLLAEANTRAIFELVQTQMRFGGVPDFEQMKIFDEMTSILQQVGCTSKEISTIQERWHYWVEGDYVRHILGNSIPNKLSNEQKVVWTQDTRILKSQANLITPEKLKEFLAKFNLPPEHYQQYLDDYEYYKKHKKHHSIERWKNRADWAHN